MLSQFKFSDILNVLVVGSIPFICLASAILIIDPNLIKMVLDYLKVEGYVTAASAIILLFVVLISRVISSFVEFLMYPIAEPVGSGRIARVHKFISWLFGYYREFFFHLAVEEGTKKSAFMKGILTGDSTNSVTTRDNISRVFGLKATILEGTDSHENYKSLLHTIQSFTEQNNTGLELYFSRYSIFYNLHARLAIAIHLCTLCYVILFIKELISHHVLNSYLTLMISGILYFITAYFGRSTKIYGERKMELLIYDFNATCARIEFSKSN